MVFGDDGAGVIHAMALARPFLWMCHAARYAVDPGDIAKALNAATAISDDRLQKQIQGRVVPESFTYGSSQQRVRWLVAALLWIWLLTFSA